MSDAPFDAVAYYRELFRLYAEGSGPTAIGEALSRSTNTIKGQIQNFRKKGIIRDDRTLYEEKFSEWLKSPGGVSARRQMEQALAGEKKERKSEVSGDMLTDATERRADRTGKTDVLGEGLTEGEAVDVRAVIQHLPELREMLAWWENRKQGRADIVPIQRGQTRSVTVRMPNTLFAEIEAEAKAREVGISDVVREWLERGRMT